ncbi:MAG: hypothetical protein IJL89_03220 [Firmicutes bacterium]|nr:hypothetical protein [Bacillota bacterium]
MQKSELTEKINSAIKNKKMLSMDIKDKDYEELTGFPLFIGDEILIISVIIDFRFDGIKAVRLSEIKYVHIFEDNSFYETICKEEQLDKKHCGIISDIKINTFKEFLEYYAEKDCFVTLECKNNAYPFDIGFIEQISDKKVWLNSFDGDGKWCKYADEININDIVLVSVYDYYSRMYYKYMKKYKMLWGDENVQYTDKYTENDLWFL